MKSIECITCNISRALVVVGIIAAAQSAAAGLYLVEFKATDAGAPTSSDSAIALLGDLIIPSLDALAKDGRIRGGGLNVGARSGVFVVDAKSHEEVTEIVHALPAWGVWAWKVSPLETFANRADLERKTVRALRGR